MSTKHEPILQQIHDLYRAGREPEALELLDKLLHSYVRQQQIQSFIKTLAELVRAYPREKPLRIRLAVAYERLGRNDKAIAHLEILADLHLEAGERRAAVDTIRRIMRLQKRG